MRLATVCDGQRSYAAVVTSDAAYELVGTDLTRLVGQGLPAALSAGQRALEGTGRSLSGLTFDLPYRPAAIRDFVTFESHVEGVRRSVDNASGVPAAWYDAPTFYFTNPHALYGDCAPVPAPVSSRALDFELEVGVVLGAGGSSMTPEQAREAIFGYTIVNDWSARDLQSREMQVGLGPAKGKDFATSIGPWIVTADELDPEHDDDGFLTLDCQVLVNDRLIGRDRLSNMHWTFAQMIAYASRDSIVVPGDLLASGTTGGGGCLAELWGRSGEQSPPPLQSGDVVRMVVGGIGELRGTVA